jgi:hypothetical protein
METTSEDQAQMDARAKASMLLKDRHERESEALAALMAAIARRAIAEEAVERETRQIASGLAAMSQLGFDDDELTALGVDIADLHVTRAAGAGGQPIQTEPPETDDPFVDTGEAGAEANGRGDGATPVTTSEEHPGGLRTTAHLGSMVNHSAAATTRPWSRSAGRAEPTT